jgi:hypothetical protein
VRQRAHPSAQQDGNQGPIDYLLVNIESAWYEMLEHGEWRPMAPEPAAIMALGKRPVPGGRPYGSRALRPRLPVPR